jgi:hypothetical protein
VPPFFGLFGHLFSGTAQSGYTLSFDNAALAAKPTQLDLSVCGSQVHSSLAQVSAHTFPDSLNSASGRTSPVLSLFPYSITYNINAALWFVNSVI